MIFFSSQTIDEIAHSINPRLVSILIDEVASNFPSLDVYIGDRLCVCVCVKKYWSVATHVLISRVPARQPNVGRKNNRTMEQQNSIHKHKAEMHDELYEGCKAGISYFFEE